MTISANGTLHSGDLLERNVDLYRDLSVVLKERLTFLRSGGNDPAAKETVEAIKAHHKALQTVLDLEASLVTRNRRGTENADLDLDAARAEIATRLAAWHSNQ